MSDTRIKLVRKSMGNQTTLILPDLLSLTGSNQWGEWVGPFGMLGKRKGAEARFWRENCSKSNLSLYWFFKILTRKGLRGKGVCPSSLSLGGDCRRCVSTFPGVCQPSLGVVLTLLSLSILDVLFLPRSLFPLSEGLLQSLTWSVLAP